MNDRESPRKYKHQTGFSIILICLNNHIEHKNAINFTNHIPVVKLITRLVLMNGIQFLLFCTVRSAKENNYLFTYNN